MKADRKTLTELLLHQYSLIIRDEGNLEGKYALVFSPVKVIVYGFAVSVLFFVSGYLMINSLLSSGDAAIGRDRVEMLYDDLTLIEDLLNKNQTYLEDFRKSMAGEKFPEAEDSKNSGDTLVLKPDLDSLKQISEAEQLLREEFEGDRREEAGNRLQLTDMTLFPPVENARILRSFIPKDQHFGVDLAVHADEPVRSAADGTVFMASWTRDSGHVIGVYHGKKLISFYKHNSVLLKEVGDRVKAGEIIAQSGNTGEFTDGPHLHLEFWYEGVPVNPQDLVSF